MKINKTILYSVCLLTIIATGCSKKKKSDHTEDDSNKIVKVTVAQAIEKQYTPTADFSGTVEPNREANLGSSIPGRIEKINYSKGSYVPEGAIIAELSDEMLVQAEIELNAILKDYERMSRLKEKNSISIMDYDHIKAKYDASKSKVDMIRKNTSIRAPFSGVLVDIMVEEGENYSFVPSVSSDMKVKSGIVTLMQLNPLKVKVEVNERESDAIRKGQSVDLSFDAYPDEKVTGKVSFISPILSAATRSTEVEITIPNNQNKLKPGMFCRTSIILPETQGVFVPLNAIHRAQGTGDDFVYILNSDSTVRRVQVTRGEIVDGLVHIPELNKDDVVVIDGKNKLDNGSTVEVVRD